MNRFDQAKLLLQVRKAQKQLKKETLEVEGGGGAVVIEITGEQKVKKVHIDPDRVDLENVGELEEWLAEAMKEAIAQSQKLAAETMKPFMGQLGNLGL
ncbi:YbaB/EbfC family nucleoid-associated protein [Candidatus Saccharibacteria bacterium]|nr:YbaB/EbfC family nucleoid-associated protein [Candidatus Saccharibacteria bacterium]